MTSVAVSPLVDDGEVSAPLPPLRTVIVLDDHRTFTDLLRFALDAEPGLRCSGVAYDLVSGLRLVAAHQPDVVVMDYEFRLDEGDGLTATAAIAAHYPDIHVVLLTGHADSGLVARAKDAGVRAVMPKNGSLVGLIEALKGVGRGGMLVHPDLLEVVTTPPDDHAPWRRLLSPREHDVLAMLMLGLRTDAIAAELGISDNTCRGYVKSLLWKLGAHSRLEAVAIARRRGLVPAYGPR